MKDEEYAQLSRKNISNISKEDVSRIVEYEYSNPDKQCHGSFTVNTSIRNSVHSRSEVFPREKCLTNRCQ